MQPDLWRIKYKTLLQRCVDPVLQGRNPSGISILPGRKGLHQDEWIPGEGAQYLVGQNSRLGWGPRGLSLETHALLQVPCNNPPRQKTKTKEKQRLMLTLADPDCRCMCMKLGSHLSQHLRATLLLFYVALPCRDSVTYEIKPLTLRSLLLKHYSMSLFLFSVVRLLLVTVVEFSLVKKRSP